MNSPQRHRPESGEKHDEMEENCIIHVGGGDGGPTATTNVSLILLGQAYWRRPSCVTNARRIRIRGGDDRS
ncbi:hypothetical protein E1B28_002221 [Marasmius oreades]|uniref:Uncharacterized protein n=1 Tax=Marasmius oreades TaxID=181124 RepID=A0A9P7UKC0_9AGAR|nr:uncharacterized protein E1B28_002221 [Marasmius oreades]KAG7086252.1 hypothetical protein E1B28_002221 [Marasmius oreades]